jgi:spore germination protein Q
MNFYQQPYGFYQQPYVPYPGQPIIQQPVQPIAQPPVQQVVPSEFPQTPTVVPGFPYEQSYIENILRLNVGKVATVYMNFENSQWGSKIFKGYVMAAGRDHIILRDLTTETRYILLMIYLNYITFDEEIEYQYPIRGK